GKTPPKDGRRHLHTVGGASTTNTKRPPLDRSLKIQSASIPEEIWHDIEWSESCHRWWEFGDWPGSRDGRSRKGSGSRSRRALTAKTSEDKCGSCRSSAHQHNRCGRDSGRRCRAVVCRSRGIRPPRRNGRSRCECVDRVDGSERGTTAHREQARCGDCLDEIHEWKATERRLDYVHFRHRKGPARARRIRHCR